MFLLPQRQLLLLRPKTVTAKQPNVLAQLTARPRRQLQIQVQTALLRSILKGSQWIRSSIWESGPYMYALAAFDD